jgi:hypothetical protein
MERSRGRARWHPPVTVYNSPSSPAAASNAGAGATTGSRYNYLVGRLRNRQITMEEATELFTMMQAMLARANETARAFATRAPGTPSVPVAPVPEAPRLATGPSSSDDLLLVGLLAMGAGAGLLAALSKRIGEPPASPPAATNRSKSSSSP